MFVFQVRKSGLDVSPQSHKRAQEREEMLIFATCLFWWRWHSLLWSPSCFLCAPRWQADAPKTGLIPESDAVGVTVVLITCTYRGQEFIRIGYYVNNEYTDPELRENPPLKPDYAQVAKAQIHFGHAVCGCNSWSWSSPPLPQWMPLSSLFVQQADTSECLWVTLNTPFSTAPWCPKIRQPDQNKKQNSVKMACLRVGVCFNILTYRILQLIMSNDWPLW